MHYVSFVAAVALLEYVLISLQTGQARQKYNVQAPATTGDPIFERHYRVQQNTVEQLVVFLPSLFLFANYVSPFWAAMLGWVFIAGRFLYARGYIADPAKRSTGFTIGFVATAILLLGGLVGALFAK
jgi:uncharacterized membrane protein YecN with MAPEG domain